MNVPKSLAWAMVLACLGVSACSLRATPAPGAKASACADPARDTVPQRPRPGEWITSGAAGPHTEYDHFPRPTDRTIMRMGLVANVLRHHHRETGRFPGKLAEVFEREHYGVDPYHDGWGHELRYTPRGARFELRAAGPDGCFGTADDIVETESEPPLRPERGSRR